MIDPTYFVSMPAYVEQVGHTRTEAAFIVSLEGLAELAGRLGTGFLADLLMAILAIIGVIAAAITPLLTALVSIGVINFIFTLSVGPHIGTESSSTRRQFRCRKTSQCYEK